MPHIKFLRLRRQSHTTFYRTDVGSAGSSSDPAEKKVTSCCYWCRCDSQHTHQAAKLVANGDALVIAAGTGIGVDSCLPDFRGDTGFWNAYSALAKAQINVTDIANLWAFALEPELAWGLYGHRLDLTVPYAGFGILRKWGDAKKGA
jgi:hypothetical protein